MNAPFRFSTSDASSRYLTRQAYGVNALQGVPFPIRDPFGLRRAVVPVFQRNPDGTAVGMGTAFHVDGWGRLLTADHVIDFIRNQHHRQIAPDAEIAVDIERTPHASVLLGYGVVFGTCSIPEGCWASAIRVDAIVAEEDANPLGVLQGAPRYRIGPDIAAMSVLVLPDAPPFHSVPLNLTNCPKVGDTVLAVGYPELDIRSMAGEDVARYLEEGMFGVYGKVTNIFPNGRDRSHPTPVFEVEADWRPGMSGGPVFNSDGEVIGIVSYSLPPGDGQAGRGYATSIGLIPEAHRLVPTLDPRQVGWRIGYGLLRESATHLAAIVDSEVRAEQLKDRQFPDHAVVRIAHHLGTEDFIVDQ